MNPRVTRFLILAGDAASIVWAAVAVWVLGTGTPLSLSVLRYGLASSGWLGARSLAQRFATGRKRPRVLMMGQGRIAQELAERMKNQPESKWEHAGYIQ